ncbi:MAG TPA: methionyl-tRNA formyltransferase [Thermodesulfovibrionales bacterium]|nr:methionyl-tRNA formyltransferase [Thermodesulfovibrionales bacterium]
MSIIFFGTPDFAVPSLRALLGEGEDVSFVVTQTDKIKGRGHKLAQPAVKIAALEAGLPVIQPTSLREGKFLEEIASSKPEFLIVVAYGKILPKALLETPQKGCINVHASLLPKYRGAAPIAWAILRGEEKTGVTTMLMDEGLDTGPVLLKREVAITAEDTAGSLGINLSEVGASLLIETLKGIREGSLKPVPQTGEPTFAPILRKEDGRIDWSRTALEIDHFVRGMQPWPGAFCYMNGEMVRILNARPLPDKGSAGLIEKADERDLIIGTGEGLLSIIEIQPSGKRPMSVSAFLQGRRLAKGMKVG